ncbi:MAG: single-stranded-DNA-specific exonuclease RecJ [Clostridia bacterium]
MQKIWNIKKYDEEYVKKVMSRYNISEIMAKLIISRNVKFEDIDVFLNGDLTYLKDPFLMLDMDKLVDRVLLSMQNKEKICIYGDYDVDGITSITIFYMFLSKLGVNVCYYLPNRLAEGYGINKKALDEIKKEGSTLLITVDCGITAVEEVEYAKSIGLDVCITDHHECSELLPRCTAVVNPKQKNDCYPFKMLAGVGVAFKCITAISKKLNLDSSSYLDYLDIVSIGTISDIVPLIDENRIISKFGLEKMKITTNVGLKALLKILNYKEIDSTMISFGMAPRINACGRMGNASVAVELLLEKDSAKADKIAEKLDSLNIQRQNVEKDIFQQANKMIEKEKLNNKNSIVLYGKDWHNGVIGIVASRLVNMYYKPVILLTKENGIIRGSGRCQVGFSLYEGLTNCKDLLLQFGGHELAAGLSIDEEKIEKFKEKFEEVVTKTATNLNEQIVNIDMEISRKDLNLQILKDVYNLRPYGQSNKEPLFIYKGLKIKAIRTIKDDKHLKLMLQDDRALIEAMAFSQGNRRDEFTLSDKIDTICNVELNSYNTPKTIQLIIQDFKKSID